MTVTFVTDPENHGGFQITFESAIHKITQNSLPNKILIYIYFFCSVRTKHTYPTQMPLKIESSEICQIDLTVRSPRRVYDKYVAFVLHIRVLTKYLSHPQNVSEPSRLA